MARPTTRDRSPFRCAECGWTAAKWVGRCGECQAWGSVAEVGAGAPGRAAVTGDVPGRGVTTPGPVTARAQPIATVAVDAARAIATGIGELDRVLGGGFVPGAVILMAGEPGVGKSTLLLEVAARCATAERPTLYVTGEESAGQVRLRAERTHALADHLMLAAETDLGAVLAHIDATEPALVVVDSVQTFASSAVDGSAGGVSQVREVAAALIGVAKERGIVVVLVGHVTKEGSIAGPRTLEHLVDVVLTIDGERGSRLRLLRAAKNRFGPTDEVGCFELGEAGCSELPDPSGLFLSRHFEPMPGTCVAVTLEGRRPLVAEVQALVAQAQQGGPRRATHGLDASRTSMILAVLERRLFLPMNKQDTYLSTIGGVRLLEPATDLAIAMALISSATEVSLPADLIAIGEIGLTGEVRRVGGLGQRLREAQRLGFRQALVPVDPGPTPDGMRIIEVGNLGVAASALTSRPAQQRRGLRTVPG